KYFNKWVSSKAAYYNLQKWMAAADKTLRLSDFAGEECYLGIDLASKLDLNAVVPVFRREIDGLSHYYCVSPMFWVPEDTVYATDPALKTIADRYQSFVNQGVLVPSDGAEVDYRLILEAILKLRKTVKIAASPIDPYGATGLSHMLQDEGLEPVTITQNYTNMSDPMREIEAAIAADRFHHDGNPLMTWCISNVVGKYLPGSDDVVRPVKEGAGNKIDGAVGLMMGVGRAMLNEPKDFLSNLDPDEDLLFL
ncbi:terminase large subunit, partial [Salmonella enterica]|nr:terminase large subunit [Salmonella enterica]